MGLHKNIRLASRNYLGQQFYFITLCCEGRRKVFSESSRCSWLLEIFRSESATRSFAIHAYCIMPDHFHFLAEGLEISSDLLGFVKDLKIKSSRVYSRQTSQILWQKKFFDHILRPNEPVESVAWYIWMNPVRKGFSTSVGSYPWAGSFSSMICAVQPEAMWSPSSGIKPPASEGGRYKC